MEEHDYGQIELQSTEESVIDEEKDRSGIQFVQISESKEEKKLVRDNVYMGTLLFNAYVFAMALSCVMANFVYVRMPKILPFQLHFFASIV